LVLIGVKQEPVSLGEKIKDIGSLLVLRPFMALWTISPYLKTPFNSRLFD